jgi:urease accessory protein
MTELFFTKRLASLEPGVKILSSLTLPYHLRQKSRLKVKLDNGVEAGLILPRGETLRDGQLLSSEDGKHIIKIRAAAEVVSIASTDNPVLMARTCYHLGNRHVALQVGDNGCRYLADHVLDEMVRSLGLSIKNETAPFEPEDGAYSQHSHSSADSHSGDNKQSHSYVYVDAQGTHSHSSSSSSDGHSHSSSSSSSSHSDSRFNPKKN